MRKFLAAVANLLHGLVLVMLGGDLALRLFCGIALIYCLINNAVDGRSIGKVLGDALWAGGCFGAETFLGTASGFGEQLGDSISQAPAVVFHSASETVANAAGAEFLGTVAGISSQLTLLVYVPFLFIPQ